MPRNARRTSTLASAPGPVGGRDRRRVSRREREQRQRRYLIIGMIAVASLVGIIALASSLNYYVLEPNGTVANVNGQNITRADYWKVRRNALLDRLQQYAFQGQLGQGSQQQLQAGSDAARMEIRGIRTYDMDPTTIQQMIEDRVILAALPSIGINLTDTDVNETVAERFAPVRLNSPTPEPTLNPTRQATAAAATAAATVTAQAISAGATATLGFIATQTATVTALTPTSNVPPTATAPPTPTGVPTQTPTNGDARATSTATLGEFIKARQRDAGMSLDDYKRLVIRPALGRQRAREVLEARAPSRGEQVRAFHILVPTEEAAREARRRVVEGGQSFEAVAMEISTDTSTKPNGGDLGYAPRGLYVKPFEDAAFSLPVNTLSEPVQTQFGYHIIKPVDRPMDREFEEATYRQVRDKQFQSWVEEQVRNAKITQGTVATPIPTPVSGFQPPAGAPATPTYTPAPSPTPGSPPAGTPGAMSAPGGVLPPGVTVVPAGTPPMGTAGAAGAAGAGGSAPTPMGGATTVIAGTPGAGAAAPAVTMATTIPAAIATVGMVAPVTAPPAIAPTVTGATAMPAVAPAPTFNPPTLTPPTMVPPAAAIATVAPPPAPPTVAPPTATPAPAPTVAQVPTAPPPPTVAPPTVAPPTVATVAPVVPPTPSA